MKDAIGSLARGRDRCRIGDIGCNDLELRRAAVLIQICFTTDGKVVDNPYPTAGGDEPVDEVTADKTGSARDDI